MGILGHDRHDRLMEGVRVRQVLVMSNGGSKLRDLQVPVRALYISNILVDCLRGICSYFLEGFIIMYTGIQTPSFP